jgi:hypothetical protein
VKLSPKFYLGELKVLDRTGSMSWGFASTSPGRDFPVLMVGTVKTLEDLLNLSDGDMPYHCFAFS